MRRRHNRRVRPEVLITVIMVLLLPVVVEGQIIKVNITAEVAGLTGVATIDSGIDWEDVLDHPDPHHPFTHTATSIPAIYDPTPGNPDSGDEIIVTTIDEITVTVKANPYILLGFAVSTGVNPVNYSFESELKSFPAYKNVSGYANAGCGISTDGTYLLGAYGDDLKAYRAVYNDSSVFADLIATIPLIYGDNSFSDEYGVGYTYMPISGDVSNIQSFWQFELGPNGTASGSSYFDIVGQLVPEPASMFLLGLGGLALLRKRQA